MLTSPVSSSGSAAAETAPAADADITSFLFRVSGGRDSTSSGCDITSGRSLLLSPPVLMVLPDSCLRTNSLNASIALE
ncbi:hypothetical protein NDU88_008148 [Pleurodeles waltl]|uniref:Uncharacterized protein n=1 Tax=Pleurodeles waltl TaxID=8319 RepID=A0AAV7SUI0_PLEWA|nr:hypothetical protein NDU88_008148 [Pleurodeles waltl]